MGYKAGLLQPLPFQVPPCQPPVLHGLVLQVTGAVVPSTQFPNPDLRSLSQLCLGPPFSLAQGSKAWANTDKVLTTENSHAFSTSWHLDYWTKLPILEQSDGVADVAQLPAHSPVFVVMVRPTNRTQVSLGLPDT